MPAVEEPTEDLLGHRPRGDQKAPGPTRTRGRTKVAELSADERCSRAILDFLATTEVSKTAGPPVGSGKEAVSEARVEEQRTRGAPTVGGGRGEAGGEE